MQNQLREICTEYCKVVSSAGINRLPIQIAIENQTSYLQHRDGYLRKLYGALQSSWRPILYSEWQPIEMRVQIDKNGTVSAVKLLHSTGRKSWDNAAEAAIAKKYEPLPTDFGQSLVLRIRFGAIANGLNICLAKDLDTSIQKLHQARALPLAKLQREIAELEFPNLPSKATD